MKGRAEKRAANSDSIFHKIYILMLILFLVTAVVLTGISQINYKNRLVKVQSASPESLNILHELEYYGKLFIQNGVYKVQWEMEDYADVIASMEILLPVNISKLIQQYSRSEAEGVKVELSTEGCYEGFVDQISQRFGVSNILECPPDWTQEDTYLVSLRFSGTKKKYVIRSNSIQYDLAEQKFFVYQILETPKIWGTEYSLKKVYVEILESNGIVTALKEYPGHNIVYDVRENYYEGMLVTN